MLSFGIYNQCVGLRVDIVSVMPSISAFLTDPKRIQTPHSLFWDFWADKSFTTCWSGCRVQGWVQVQAPACHLAITPEGCSRRQLKVYWFRGQNQWLSSWGRAPALLALVRLASRFFCIGNEISMEWTGSCCQPKPRPCFAQSCYHSSVSE